MNKKIFNQPNIFEAKKKKDCEVTLFLPVTQTVTIFEPK